MYIVRCAQESGCFVGWKSLVGFCLLLQLLEFTDALISFGELEHDFITCDSMLLIPLGELYVEPLDPSPGLFRFLQSHVKSIGIDAETF